MLTLTHLSYRGAKLLELFWYLKSCLFAAWDWDKLVHITVCVIC